MIVGNCLQCEYDLRAHSVGDACPECGRSLSEKDFEVKTPRYVCVLLLISCAISPVALALVPLWGLLAHRHRGSLLITAIAFLHYTVCLLLAARQINNQPKQFYWWCYTSSCASGVIPLIILLVAYAYFVSGGYSTLYDGWLMLFTPLLYGSVLSSLIPIALIFAPPNRTRLIVSFALPIAALNVCICSLLILLTHYPK